MIGTVYLDRYQIASELGQGGMGVVYRAHDRVLDRDVAVKVLSTPALGTEGRARMLREAQSAAQLNHPNIVSIYDAGEKDGVPYIIMELVEGESLHARPPASLDEVFTVSQQVCLALEHAHSRGIIHRDLKPENIVNTPGGQVKLMDFGLARSVASRLTQEGSIVGSVFYLAPELALGQEFDGRSDLYSLGVMLYEFLTGELPFNANDPLAIISQHIHAPPVPPRARQESVPPALDALILRLLSKHADDRPASAREVLLALERLQAGEALSEAIPKPVAIEGLARGHLVGRARELEEAKAVWNRARLGQSSVLLISGEPGIGKTRLSHELAAQVQVQGGMVLTGNCYPEAGAPYEPLAQVLEGAARSYPLERLASLPYLLAISPGLRARFPNLDVATPSDPQVDQQRMLENLVELFTDLTKVSPVLVLLEDAHWADSGTLAALRHLARRAAHAGLRLLLLLTYREVELDEARALNQLLYDLNRERLGVRVKLSRLDRDATGELITALLVDEIGPRVRDRIFQETEGNPFFIEEVCKALVESGAIYRQDGRWRLSPDREIEIPQSVRVAIQARVARLAPTAQDILRTASIFGRQFDFDSLKGMSELDEDSLIEALEDASRAQLITEVRPAGKSPAAGGNQFCFAHALVASSLRESMSGLRRQRLHHRAALVLERLHPAGQHGLAPLLGHHFAEAGVWDKAVHYLLQAGDEARAVYAYPEAIEFYENALVVLKDQGNTGRAARTLMKLGLLYHATFDFQRSRQIYQEGFTLWKQAGEASTGTEVTLPAAPHPLRISWTNLITLDPGLAFEAGSVPLINQVFSGLVSLTPDLDVTPEMAQSWEVLDDGRRYRFYLRPDATWSDGTRVTAADFEYAWKRVLDPATRSRNQMMFYDVRAAKGFAEGSLGPDSVGVRALDEMILEVELERPTGYFLHLLTYTATYPVPRHIVQAHGDEWTQPGKIVTNGPFMLQALLPGEQMALRRNPRYCGNFSGNVDQVEIRMEQKYAQFAERFAVYEADELDVCWLGGTPHESDRARQRHAGEYISHPNANVNFLVFNVDKPPFDDVRVRRAFAMTVDRETLAEVLWRGYFQPASGGLTPPGIPGHVPGIGHGFHPEEARRLMAEAGFPGGKGFPLVEIWGGQTENRRFNEVFCEQWREHLGVESRWVYLATEKLYLKMRKERPPIFLHGWVADYPDPDSFMRVGVAYQTSWHYPPYQALEEEARQATDQAERLRIYGQAEQILMEQVPLTPIFYNRNHTLVKPWVRRYVSSPIQPLIFKEAILEAH